MKAFYGYRNFTLEDAGGSTLAYANSVWVLVDTRTGRPVKVPQEFADTYGLEPQLEMECAKRKLIFLMIWRKRVRLWFLSFL